MRIEKILLSAALAGVVICLGGCTPSDAGAQGKPTSQGPSASNGADMSSGDLIDSSDRMVIQSDSAMTPEIEAQFCEDLRQAAQAGDTVAAYVDDIPIYKRQVEVGLAFSNQTNSRNLQIITDPDEREAYLAKYDKNYDDMLNWFINQEIGILEGKKAGINLDEQEMKDSARAQWEQAIQDESVQKMVEALGITPEEYFETYQLPGTRRSAYFNQLFEDLLPSANYQDEGGRLDKDKRDADIAAKLKEMRKEHTVKIL